MRTLIESIMTSVKSGEIKLKDAKENFSVFVASLESPAGYVSITGDAVIKARTKEAFCDALGDFATAAEHEEASKVEVDLMEPVTELERLTAAITVAIEAQTKGYFELGKLLIEAKEQFDKASDFLQWADDTFSFKKAYVYRVMQVSQQFKDEIWHDVPLRNLFTLAQQGTSDDIENARLFIEKGGVLNLANLSILLDGQAQNKRTPVKGPSAEETQKDFERAANELSGVLINEAQTDMTPRIPVAGEVSANKPTEPPAAAPVAQDAVLLAIEPYLKQIADLTRQLAEATKPKLRDMANIPTLRQFRSPCLRTRLGLSEEESQDKATILEAFREFCKAGYGRGHEAFELIDTARHELIHSIKVPA